MRTCADQFTLPLLTDFLTWLRGQPDLRVIGVRTNCGACPLAVWLQHVYQRPVVVDDETVLIGAEQDYRRVATPQAYRDFMDSIDYLGQPGANVMVEEARTVALDVLRDRGELRHA